MGRKEEVMRFPAYQNMISVDDSATIRRRHTEHLRFYRATLEDCWIESMHPAHAHESPFQTHFQLHWTTYLGWKVYMLHTGCYSIIPDLEERS
jgi:hypothetical protein